MTRTRSIALAVCLSLICTLFAVSPVSAQSLLDTTAATVTFDTLIASGPEPGCGYVGFRADTATGGRVQGYPAYSATAVTAGVTTPQTYNGNLDSSGYAVLPYCPPASVVVDPVAVTFTATVGAATGVAVRSWDVDGIDGSCTSSPCSTTAVAVAFDDAYLSGPDPGCGYVGFSATTAGGGRVQGYKTFRVTATTAGDDGPPQLHDGILDSNGASSIYYCPPAGVVGDPFAVTFTATVDAATGVAVRSWDADAPTIPCSGTDCVPSANDPCYSSLDCHVEVGGATSGSPPDVISASGTCDNKVVVTSLYLPAGTRKKRVVVEHNDDATCSLKVGNIVSTSGTSPSEYTTDLETDYVPPIDNMAGACYGARGNYIHSDITIQGVANDDLAWFRSSSRRLWGCNSTWWSERYTRIRTWTDTASTFPWWTPHKPRYVHVNWQCDPIAQCASVIHMQKTLFESSATPCPGEGKYPIKIRTTVHSFANGDSNAIWKREGHCPGLKYPQEVYDNNDEYGGGGGQFEYLTYAKPCVIYSEEEPPNEANPCD